MKLSWSFIISSLYCAAEAANEGHVYIYDPMSRSSLQTPPTVDPNTARLIFAQRLGISRFHSIKTPTEVVLKQINAFGGHHPNIFGGDVKSTSKAHVLVWLEDVEDVEETIKYPELWSSSFLISEPPQASDNGRLIADMILQAKSLPQMTDSQGKTYTSIMDADGVLSTLKQPDIYNEYLTVLRADKTDKFTPTDLAMVLANLQSRASSQKEEGFAITLVMMPPSSRTKHVAYPYGTYDLPTNLQARNEPTEAPLSLFASEPSSSPSLAVPNLEDFPVITQDESGNNTTPPLGIIPRCFEDVSVCNKATNQCSGHGKCSLLSKGEKGSNGRRPCYGCTCTPTVEDRGDTGMEQHKKTTYWGGSACQKKDISVPFWLFVSSGVLFAFLISAGIGLLYSVGSEELPSVIGAGVSGPVRK